MLWIGSGLDEIAYTKTRTKRVASNATRRIRLRFRVILDLIRMTVSLLQESAIVARGEDTRGQFRLSYTMLSDISQDAPHQLFLVHCISTIVLCHTMPRCRARHIASFRLCTFSFSRMRCI